MEYFMAGSDYLEFRCEIQKKDSKYELEMTIREQVVVN